MDRKYTTCNNRHPKRQYPRCDPIDWHPSIKLYLTTLLNISTMVVSYWLVVIVFDRACCALAIPVQRHGNESECQRLYMDPKTLRSLRMRSIKLNAYAMQKNRRIARLSGGHWRT